MTVSEMSLRSNGAMREVLDRLDAQLTDGRPSKPCRTATTERPVHTLNLAQTFTVVRRKRRKLMRKPAVSA